MSPAAEFVADIKGIGSDIKSFGADHAKVNFGEANVFDFVSIDMNETRFPFHHFALAGEFVEGDAVFFDR